MSWTQQQIQEKLEEIKNRGFIGIPANMYRNDDGIVGQIIEREFGVAENNLSVRDLGEFELKGMRKASTTLTMCHKTPSSGLNPIEIFDRFGYERPSLRHPGVLKKKLFTTIKGGRINNLGFILKPQGKMGLDLFYQNEFLSRWNLTEQIQKMGQVILVIAETKGVANSTSERFHYIEAYLMNGLNELQGLIENQIVVVDLCIDQVVDGTKGPHDRGPHIRIPKSKLKLAYRQTERIL